MSGKKNGPEGGDYAWIDFGVECDLHFFGPGETAAVIHEFIRQAVKKGIPRLRLVHGKGKSAKKREACEILESHPDVAGFRDDGPNWGATIITIAAIREGKE